MPDDDSLIPGSDFKSLRGRLLLAEPCLQDGVFNRAVILLIQHHPDGATGLILNQPTGKTIEHFLNQPGFEPLRHLPVHHGGPVTHEQLTFSSLWQTPKRGLNWACRISLEEAIAQSHRPKRMVRAFLGYAGWSAGQLEQELKRNAWFVARPPRDLLGMAHDESMWTALMRSLSPLHRLLAEAPANPFLN